MYELRPRERRHKGGWIIPAICIVITVLCFAIIAVLVLDDIPIKPTTRVKNIASNVPPISIAITPTQSALQNVISKVIPTPTLVDKLRQRAVGCTEDERVAFLKDATRINDVFQDNFHLAVSVPRIAMAPIISELQKGARELKQLTPDPCGKIVLSHMINAYDIGIEALLGFAGQNLDQSSVDTAGSLIQLQMREFGAYQVDMVGPLIAEDLARLVELTNKKVSSIPAELVYVQLYQEHKMNCKDAAFMERVLSSIVKATRDNFSDLGLAQALKGFADKTPTPAPCVP